MGSSVLSSVTLLCHLVEIAFAGLPRGALAVCSVETLSSAVTLDARLDGQLVTSSEAAAGPRFLVLRSGQLGVVWF